MKNLIIKECKNILKSLIYVIFVISIGVSYYSLYYVDVQNGFKQADELKSKQWSLKLMEEPKDLGDIDFEQYYKINKKYPYGVGQKEIPQQIKQLAFMHLIDEYSHNEYSYYPYGFIQYKVSTSSEKERIAEIMEELAGRSMDEIMEAYSSEKTYNQLLDDINIDYDRFKELMAELNDIIGKGSTYDFENLKSISSEPLTYEDAKEQYYNFLNVDKISNGYGRLSADYLGVVYSLFPVFIVVYVVLKDKRSKMQDIIYSSRMSSSKLIISRYIAIVTMCMIPVLIIGIISAVQLLKYVPSNFLSYFDYFAFIKYELWWILPTVMIVCALGMAVTLLAENYLAVIVQIGLAFIAIENMGIIGNYGLGSFFIRFNSSGKLQIYEANIIKILFNRSFYMILSLILVKICIKVFELKREGRLNNEFGIRKIFKSNKVQYKHMAEK